MLVPQEITMIVSSNPENGASNVSTDGSYFEIQLEEALTLPSEALSPTLSVEEATVWWSVPNIITGKNDKMYITGTSALPVITNRNLLGFPGTATFSMTIVSPNVSTLIMFNLAGGMPIGAFIVGDKFRDDDPLSISYNVEYTITHITLDTANNKTYTVSGLLEGNILADNGGFSRVRYNSITNYIITIPQGLYDLNGINQAILRGLENAGAKTDPDPLIVMIPDEATSKVQIKFNYATVSIDFTPADTPRDILGFNSAVYGTYPTAPITIVAPNIAGFNTVNYFLIHSDLTSRGIRFNNNYSQTIAQVLIDVSPGSQIVNKPFNPAKIPVNELVGAKRNNIRMWITDDSNNRINMNNEYWSARIVIRYLKPYLIGSESLRR